MTDPEILLLTATAMEMRAVIQGLRLDIPVPQPGTCVSGVVRGIPVQLALTGIGPLAAAFAAGRLIGEKALTPNRCRGLLCLGIAGTYVPNAVPIGSIVVAFRETWPEYGLVMEGGIDAEALGFPLLQEKHDTGLPPVWDSLPLDPAAALARMGLNDPATAPRMAENPLVFGGSSLTVAGVSGTRSRARYLAARHAAMTENMEGFPLALAAHDAGLPFAEIRSVSNIVGDRSPEAWNIPAALAALTRATELLFLG